MRLVPKRIFDCAGLFMAIIGVACVGHLVAQELEYLHRYFEPHPTPFVYQAAPTWNAQPPALPTLADLPTDAVKVSTSER